MKTEGKIILCILGVIVGIVLLDSALALIFNNKPFIGIETKCMKAEGLLVSTYHCGNGKNITKIELYNSSCDYNAVCGNN